MFYDPMNHVRAWEIKVVSEKFKELALTLSDIARRHIEDHPAGGWTRNIQRQVEFFWDEQIRLEAFARGYCGRYADCR